MPTPADSSFGTHAPIEMEAHGWVYRASYIAELLGGYIFLNFCNPFSLTNILTQADSPSIQHKGCGGRRIINSAISSDEKVSGK